MADDPTSQAISISTGIVSALGAAGLLQPQVEVATRAPLAQAPLAQAPQQPPPPLQNTQPPPTLPPPRAVGDIAYLDNPDLIEKIVQTKPNQLTQFTLTFGATIVPGQYGPTTSAALLNQGERFTLKFPPNDTGYIPELDRLLTLSATVKQPFQVKANMDITDASLGQGLYEATLTWLWVYGQTGYGY